MNFDTKNNLETSFNSPLKTQIFFFDGWNHLYLLDIIPVKYNMQNQQNLMKQFRDNGHKALFWRQKSKYFGDTFSL